MNKKHSLDSLQHDLEDYMKNKDSVKDEQVMNSMSDNMQRQAQEITRL